MTFNKRLQIEAKDSQTTIEQLNAKLNDTDQSLQQTKLQLQRSSRQTKDLEDYISELKGTLSDYKQQCAALQAQVTDVARECAQTLKNKEVKSTQLQANFEQERQSLTEQLQLVKNELENLQKAKESDVQKVRDQVHNDLKAKELEIKELKKHRDTLFGEHLLNISQSSRSRLSHYRESLQGSRRDAMSSVNGSLIWAQGNTPPSVKRIDDFVRDIQMPTEEPQQIPKMTKMKKDVQLDELEMLVMRALDGF